LKGTTCNVSSLTGNGLDQDFVELQQISWAFGFFLAPVTLRLFPVFYHILAPSSVNSAAPAEGNL